MTQPGDGNRETVLALLDDAEKWAVLKDCVQELLLGSRAHAVHPFALYDANCGACRKTRLVKRAQTALAAERASGEGQP